MTTTEQKTNEFITMLNTNNVSNYIVSKSVTSFGDSNYFKFYSSDYREIAVVRISDHSVGVRRVFNEISYESLKKIEGVFDNLLKVYNSWN